MQPWVLFLTVQGLAVLYLRCSDNGKVHENFGFLNIADARGDGYSKKNAL